MASKEILVVGFGAVGTIFSLICKRSERAVVTAVARSNFDAVNKNGMHIKSEKYGDVVGWKPDRLCNSVSSAADRSYDYVILTTKAIPDLTTTPQVLAPLLSRPYTENFRQPAYVILQNGLNVERDLYNAIKALDQEQPKVIGTCLWIATNLRSPDVVEHSGFDRPTLGVYRPDSFTATSNTPEESEILNGIASILKAGGSTVSVVAEIQSRKFAKNFWNLAFASLATLTNSTLPAIFRDPPKDPAVTYSPYIAPKTAHRIREYTIPALDATLQELLTLGRALGFPDSEDGLPSDLVQRTIANTRALHVKPESVHVPSMLLDLRNGTPLEVEVIVGEVVRMARSRNVPVPRIEMLYALLLVVQNQIIRKIEEKSKM
ncbi:6-phosphogluconate dehydrogenase C-terminal domain-like protein [Dendrothele bispora CBS 962.96]|uniref:6-phosphogluconate dehydrogenase C-terminal domain-like protein n=1 Tax=Dendrothele bispora (strain CBS 962.96) TaxID=1314807 RepID=A0A4S8MXZ2_DENBC|nr:6-phosphogluconate dehydrogenase C-terminal domain-like protein [Dendrothele bispora CBS 962.96]